MNYSAQMGIYPLCCLLATQNQSNVERIIGVSREPISLCEEVKPGPGVLQQLFRKRKRYQS